MLLRSGSSMFYGEAPLSRSVTAASRTSLRTWGKRHRESAVIYREPAAAPVPHTTVAA
ncbi:hypothetical protein [Streptomyces echinatus]|uniref:hypothetical protein n=1 Tax=Streptomyces echinatus TaxID=67293 RepID=UPI003791E6CC